MRLLVDKIPSKPEECIFHSSLELPLMPAQPCSSEDTNDPQKCITVHKCTVKGAGFCEFGQEGFKCPYLMKFKAVAKEGIPGYGGNIVRHVPVYLVEQRSESHNEKILPESMEEVATSIFDFLEKKYPGALISKEVGSCMDGRELQIVINTKHNNPSDVWIDLSYFH